ncbi:MAG: hypothetical protein HY318_05655 [Armatimonadetes bacterium]|nr:hypothetical protein [Armatimonadota bacterium]
MEEPFQPAMEFVAEFPSLQPGETKVSGLTTAKLAFVESLCRTDVLSVDYELIGQKAPDGIVHAFPNFRRQGWVTE